MLFNSLLMFYLINGTINGYLYLVLGNPGKLRVYHGPFSLAQGLDAPNVTRYTHAFVVRFRVEEILSYSLSHFSCGVRLVHHFTLRVLGFQARIILIAVHITAFTTNTKTYKVYSSNPYQPSVVVDLQLLSGLHSRSTQAPDLVSCRLRHFSEIRGYTLISNIASSFGYS